MDCDMIEEGLKWNKLYLKIDGGWIEEKFASNESFKMYDVT